MTPQALIYQADCPEHLHAYIRGALDTIRQWEKAENIRVMNIRLSDSGVYYVRFERDEGGRYPVVHTRDQDKPPVYGLVGDLLELGMLQSVTLLNLDFPANHQGKVCFKLRQFTECHYTSVWIPPQ